MDQVDVIVVGAGVVGLAIAARMSKHHRHVMLVDQNTLIGEETSSRNSEVIHAGIYYPKDSLKALLCVRGKTLLYEYCQKQKIPHQAIGKLIVATQQDELDTLYSAKEKAIANGVLDLEHKSHQQLKHISPDLNAAEALYSPSTGIIDSHTFMQSLLGDLERQGGMFVGQTRCEHIIQTSHGFEVSFISQGESITLNAPIVINSAGLGAQTLAEKIDNMPKEHIPPLHLCRGHYFSYSGKNPFSQLVYPLPEKGGAGLGIHATLDLGNQLKFGPDTQYLNKGIDYQFDPLQIDFIKQKFTTAIQRYWPTMEPEKLHPAYIGIRPKLQGPDDGFKDFVIQNGSDFGLNGLINLYGIESPGLTSSLAIAEYVADLV